MNLKNIRQFLVKIPFIYLFALSTLFLLIILATVKTHHKVESYYELAHLKGKYESKLNQLTSDELNEIRLSIISRIGDFSKILNKFKLNKSNSTINLDQIPDGILKVGKLIKKWPENQFNSLNIILNDLKIFYLNRIILDDTVIDKQSSIVNILMKLKGIKFIGKFSLCLKNSTINCLDGEFEQLSNETLINWSAKLTILDQIKFNLNDINLKNYLDFNKLTTKIQLNNEKKSNHFLDQIVFEFIKPYLNKEFSKLINYEIGQTISTIYADLFDNQANEQKIKKSTIKSDLKFIDDQEESFLNDNLNKNQTTIQFLHNLINLPSMISNMMFKLIDQNLDTRNTPKVTFYNQDIEQILKTNLSTLQALKNKYLSSLREHFENLNLDGKAKQQSLPDIAQPFFQLVENQLRDTIETKIDSLINTMSNLNNHLTKLKTDDNQQESSNEQLTNVFNNDFNSEIEHNIDNDDILPENDEIIDEYTQTIRSQRTKRQVPCQRGQELDEYVDSLFRFASRLIRAMEPVSIPNATIDLPEYNIKMNN